MIELGVGRLMPEGNVRGTTINQFSLLDSSSGGSAEKVVLTEVINGCIGQLVAVPKDRLSVELVIGTGMLTYESNRVINLHGMAGAHWLEPENCIMTFFQDVTLYFRKSTR